MSRRRQPEKETPFWDPHDQRICVWTFEHSASDA
jgi:hypothetical protein